MVPLAADGSVGRRVAGGRSGSTRWRDWRQQRAPVRSGYSYVLASVAVTARKDERVYRSPRFTAVGDGDER